MSVRRVNAPAEARGGRDAGQRAATARVRTSPGAALPAPTAERVPLPHRDLLEERFGRSLGEIAVYCGPQVAAALVGHDALAASQHRRIFLADAAPPVAVVAHEVVHVLQRAQGGRDGGPAATPSAVEPANAPAEQEATRLAGAVTAPRPGGGDVVVDESLPEDAVALLRASSSSEDAIAISLTAPSPPPSLIGAPAAGGTAGSGPGAPATPRGPAAGPAGPSPGSAAGGVAGAPADVLTELPASAASGPDVTRSAQQAAEQQVVQATAERAMASAATPADLLRTFATAPPTAKARQAATLAAQAAALADTEARAVQSDVPDLHAHLDRASGPEASVTVVAPPPARTVELTEPSVAPAPEPEVWTPPPMSDYRPETDVSAPFNRLTTAEPAVLADQIGSSLGQVPIVDADLPRSPGPVPSIPLAGDSDPGRIASTQAAAQGAADSARADAAQAVLAGPGPERVRPRAVDEAYPIGELPVTTTPVQPVVAAESATEGPQAYLAMGLPPDVQAAFDEEQQVAMEQSAAGVAQQAEQATTARDEAKQAAVSDAQAGVVQLNETAGGQQADAVATARADIQAARQDTLARQQTEVDRVATEADSRRQADEERVRSRITTDQTAIDASYADAQSKIDAKVSDGERRAAAEKADAEQAAEEESWWDRAVSFVKDAFDALVSAIGAIFDAIRAAVNAILDAVKAAALAIIDAAAAFVKEAIAAYAALLKAAVEGLLGDIFPELAKALTEAIDEAAALAIQAVDAAADTLKAGVNALVEKLRAGLLAAIDAYQSAVTLAVGLVGAAITGDWTALARKVLEAVLNLVGVDPESFYGFVGRGQETWQRIIDDPGAFLGNVLAAVTGGVQRFADNFVTHLQAGVIGWLTGALGNAGIVLPQTFDLVGVLDIARQILGLTWDALRGKAAKLIGEKNVERLEIVYDWITALVVEGWAGLWAKIIDSVATVRDVVLDSLKSFLVEKVVVAAITKLASLFSPVGAIVQLVITAWNLYTFLRDQLSRIAAVVTTVVNAIGDIARGVLDGAVAAVEGVLGRLLPIAIDLLARLLGLGNVAERVRGIIEGIRAMIDRGIVTVIGRVAAAFRGGPAEKSGTTSTPGDKADRPDATPGMEEETFTVAGEKHTLRAALQGDAMEPEMASGPFAGLNSRMSALTTTLTALYLDPASPQYVGTAKAAKLTKDLAALQKAASDLVLKFATAKQKKSPQVLHGIVSRGFAALVKRVNALDLPEATPEAVHPGHGPTAGSKASYDRQTWFRVNPLSTDSIGKGLPARGPVPGIGILPGAYQMGHLVAKALGGHGDKSNLVPMSPAANTKKTGIQSTEYNLRTAFEHWEINRSDYPPDNPFYVFNYTVEARYRDREPANLDADLGRHGIQSAGVGARLFSLGQQANEQNKSPDDDALLNCIQPRPPADTALAANLRRRLTYYFNPSEIMPTVQVRWQPQYFRLDITSSGSVAPNEGVDLLWHG
jgi:hypothetical protein